MRSLKENIKAVANLEMIITIGLVFAGLMILAYVVFTIQDTLIPDFPTHAGGGSNATQAAWNASYLDASNSISNVTGGFDSAVNLLIIAITIFIMALMISALYLIKAKNK